jgi:hypothetical protein
VVDGILYVADGGNHRIRAVNLATEIVDSAVGGGLGEGGRIEDAAGAELAFPVAVGGLDGSVLVTSSAMGAIKIFVPVAVASE